MELSDALTVTGLGMAVVFSGLLLTAGLIVAFGRAQSVAERLPWRRPSRPEPAPVVAAEASAPVGPETVAVIVAALEVERRLYRAEEGRRLTIRGR